MKKLSYTLATLAVIGFGMLPVNALENNASEQITEQIQQSTKPQQGNCSSPPCG